MFPQIIVVLCILLLIAIPGNADTESFDSEASAAANGWTLFNGVGNWGWQSSNFAGGDPGEARADSYIAGVQRWYADLDLREPLERLGLSAQQGRALLASLL